MRTTRPILTTLTILTLMVLTGCAGADTDAEPSDTASTSAAPSPDGDSASSPPAGASTAPAEPAEPAAREVKVTVSGGEVTPNGKRVDLKVNEPLVLRVTSDRAGELHAHSRPEQTLAYSKGTSTLRLKVENPGVVDVEDHETGIVVLQLEVR